MDVLRENWFWILIVIFFVWMHIGMHGGHGHGAHGGRSQKRGGGCRPEVDAAARERTDDETA